MLTAKHTRTPLRRHGFSCSARGPKRSLAQAALRRRRGAPTRPAGLGRLYRRQARRKGPQPPSGGGAGGGMNKAPGRRDRTGASRQHSGAGRDPCRGPRCQCAMQKTSAPFRQGRGAAPRRRKWRTRHEAWSPLARGRRPAVAGCGRSHSQRNERVGRGRRATRRRRGAGRNGPRPLTSRRRLVLQGGDVVALLHVVLVIHVVVEALELFVVLEELEMFVVLEALDFLSRLKRWKSSSCMLRWISP